MGAICVEVSHPGWYPESIRTARRDTLLGRSQGGPERSVPPRPQTSPSGRAMNARVVKTEWWYDGALFGSDHSTIYLACLLVFAERSVEIWVESDHYAFDSEHDAEIWLSEEEYSPLQELLEDHDLHIIPPT